MYKNEDGYALPFILFITILVISLLVGLITLLFFLNNAESKKINKKKLDLACFSAVQKVMVSLQESYGEDIFFEQGATYGESEIIYVGDDTVLIKNILKGLFYELTASAGNGKDSSKIKYLLGYHNFFPSNTALTISRPGLRATVTGNTKISGDISATTDRITKGKIFGIENSTENYLTGRINVDADIKIKMFNDSLLSLVRPSGLFVEGDEYLLIEDDFTVDEFELEKLKVSQKIYVRGNLVIKGNIDYQASDKSLEIYVSGKTIIEDNTFSNINMEIKCDSVIQVGRKVKMSNVILSSSKGIEIGESSYFKNCQVFSSDNIHMVKSQLDYPAVICMYVDASDTSAINNRLQLESTVVNGTVMLISSTTGISQNKSRIDIDEESSVQGFVYSENNLRMPGKVEGFVYTYGFWYYKEPTEYINWLVNVKINRKTLSSWYLLPRGFPAASKLEILKEEWVY